MSKNKEEATQSDEQPEVDAATAEAPAAVDDSVATFRLVPRRVNGRIKSTVSGISMRDYEPHELRAVFRSHEHIDALVARGAFVKEPVTLSRKEAGDEPYQTEANADRYMGPLVDPDAPIDH